MSKGGLRSRYYPDPMPPTGYNSAGMPTHGGSLADQFFQRYIDEKSPESEFHDAQNRMNAAAYVNDANAAPPTHSWRDYDGAGAIPPAIKNARQLNFKHGPLGGLPKKDHEMLNPFSSAMGLQVSIEPDLTRTTEIKRREAQMAQINGVVASQKMRMQPNPGLQDNDTQSANPMGRVFNENDKEMVALNTDPRTGKLSTLAYWHSLIDVQKNALNRLRLGRDGTINDELYGRPANTVDPGILAMQVRSNQLQVDNEERPKDPQRLNDHSQRIDMKTIPADQQRILDSHKSDNHMAKMINKYGLQPWFVSDQEQQNDMAKLDINLAANRTEKKKLFESIVAEIAGMRPESDGDHHKLQTRLQELATIAYHDPVLAQDALRFTDMQKLDAAKTKIIADSIYKVLADQNQHMIALQSKSLDAHTFDARVASMRDAANLATPGAINKAVHELVDSMYKLDAKKQSSMANQLHSSTPAFKPQVVGAQDTHKYSAGISQSKAAAVMKKFGALEVGAQDTHKHSAALSTTKAAPDMMKPGDGIVDHVVAAQFQAPFKDHKNHLAGKGRTTILSENKSVGDGPERGPQKINAAVRSVAPGPKLGGL